MVFALRLALKQRGTRELGYGYGLYFHSKDALLPNNSGNQMMSQNPKWRCEGNLKAKIGDNLNSSFVTLECYFHLVR